MGLKIYNSKRKPLIKPLFLMWVLSWFTISLSWILWFILESFVRLFSAPIIAFGNRDELSYFSIEVSLLLWMVFAGLGIWKFVEML